MDHLRLVEMGLNIYWNRFGGMELSVWDWEDVLDCVDHLWTRQVEMGSDGWDDCNGFGWIHFD